MELVASHWIYLIGILLIVLTMLFRKNVLVPAILMTFVVGFAFSGSIISGFQTIFMSSLVAASELFNIFLIIAIMTALLQSLDSVGASEQMVRPFSKVMTNATVSYIVLIAVTYGISLFFWPTPAVPLVGALLLPVAVRAGLPPLYAAGAIALAGQGMALSSDYMIQIAPMLSATAAGVSVSSVADRALVLSLITGVVAMILMYLFFRNERKQFTDKSKRSGARDFKIKHARTRTWKSTLFSTLTPVVFAAVILYMLYTALFTDLQYEGSSGAALIGGVSVILLVLISCFYRPKHVLDDVSNHLVDGFLFAFKAMGPVIPIAGFFFLGSGDFSSAILGIEQAPSFLFDIVRAGEHLIPSHPAFTAFGLLFVGMLTGLDGSGFSGLPLTGALAGALAPVSGIEPATLAAIGQMGAIWVGGGTLIAWSSLVAVAGVAKVNVQQLVRLCFIPVVVGLLISTLVALLLW
ncbi:putative membrane protein [Alkalihalobacillus xiaoxiensis]|uniref:Membrane protein n=1 Tax=Shouchella xiaoxiensis TaxID=766895 RepID=A0ABS2T0Q9_9BACI|nr:hypothetical protein [Shouchella xiaoxiensis]MBM7841036.1 putative membrane protein [Shouchella xiaoxiensis]